MWSLKSACLFIKASNHGLTWIVHQANEWQALPLLLHPPLTLLPLHYCQAEEEEEEEEGKKGLTIQCDNGSFICFNKRAGMLCPFHATHYWEKGEVHYKYSKAYIIQTQTCYPGSHLKRHRLPPASFGRKWCGLFISHGRNCAFTKVKELASVTNVKFRSKNVTNTLVVFLS